MLSRLRIAAPAATHGPHATIGGAQPPRPRRIGTNGATTSHAERGGPPISPTSADHDGRAERLGIVVRDQPGGRVAEIARLAESAGFTDLFLPEMGYAATTGITGRDPFIASATALAATTRLRVGPGVAITPVRAARSMALLAATCQEDSAGRFMLGCGISHRGALAAIGLPFPDSPMAHMTAYLAELRELSHRNLAFGRGFPVLLGALGPRMLRLSATAADGAVLNWLTPEHAESTSRAMVEAADETGNARPETALYIRIGEPESVLTEADTYLTRFPNYRRHFDRQGLHTAEEVARRTAIDDLGPSAVRSAIAGYRAAGISLPCLSPAGMSTDQVRELLESLARG
jgi:alkanesulfonate monooxygenase SsuD/methylene tetrahydromethanopterin reductase-like flavin-dependent oxidoreductase (luciferase family)